MKTGTRQPQTSLHICPDGRSDTRRRDGDIGMSKRVVASVTFVNSTTKQAQAANGTFAAFSANDIVFVQGANLNNGTFYVTGIDSTNHAYLVLDPSPKNEGPITVVIQTN